MSTSNNIFEAKYLAIKWADKESALSIKESKDSLPIDMVSETQFSLEAITFSKLDDEQFGQFGQLAFRVIDKNITQPIYFLKANGDKAFLRPVLDNLTKKVWWVESEVWFKGSKKNKKEDKRWQSEIFRTSGSVMLSVGIYSCQIKIGACSFSYEQLSNYLEDFKNDLWYLALHESSYISAPAKEKSVKVLDESSIEYFNRFIEFAEKVAQKPKSELREIQELKNIKKVKPTPRTFMEIATKGYAKQLTSRAYKASYNVPENQYVLFVIIRIFSLLKNLGKVSSYISTSLKDKIINQQERIDSFTDTIEINRESVKYDYYELKQKIVDEQDAVSYALSQQRSGNFAQGTHDIELTVTLGPHIPYYTYFLAFYIREQTGLYELKENEFYKLFFDNAFIDALEAGNTYQIRATVSYKVTPTKTGKIAHELKLIFINNLSILSSLNAKKFQQFEKEAIELKKHGWKRKLTFSEKNEQKQEIVELKHLIETASNSLESNHKLASKLTPTLNKFKDLYQKIIKLKVTPDSLFPNSMSFIQNPNYQGVHKLYKEIQNISGIDESVFKGLEETEDIGILNTSLIYERWCFLQIIKVLIDKLGFVPEKNWKKSLLNQVINFDPDKVRNVLLKFENKKTNRNISLWYEKELPQKGNGNTPRRADFVIDLTSSFNDKEIKSKRLVLDAKFYERIDQMGGISTVINELYNIKDYSDSSKNKVFILHPSLKSVPAIQTPQEWAESSFFGETKLFDWDAEYPNHQYGGLLLSPIQNKGKYLDNLQMCIGMFLQYGIEDNLLKVSEYNDWVQSQSHINKSSGFNPMPSEKHFCVLCGNDEYTLEVQETYYGLKWVLTCSDCIHKTYYNYCINKSCRSRLVKHGSYWTYHATQSMEPYNIKCPSCGEIVVNIERE